MTRPTNAGTAGAASGRDSCGARLSRRRFLGGAAAALAAARPAAALAFAAPPERGKLVAVIDRSLPPAQAFGAAAAAQGLPVLEFAADAGGLWMHTLEPLLRAGPLALAGLTGAGCHFALDVLSRAYGLGTVLRIEHAPAALGARHRVAASSAAAAELEELLVDAGASWPACAARSIARGAPAEPRSRLELVDRAAPRGGASRPLYSWLLARPG